MSAPMSKGDAGGKRALHGKGKESTAQSAASYIAPRDGILQLCCLKPLLWLQRNPILTVAVLEQVLTRQVTDITLRVCVGSTDAITLNISYKYHTAHLLHTAITASDAPASSGAGQANASAVEGGRHMCPPRPVPLLPRRAAYSQSRDNLASREGLHTPPLME